MKKILLLFALFGAKFSFSQITVSPAGGPSQVATLLTGNGVTMTNVVITGDTNAYGNFLAFGSSLGMNGGLVMTTGLRSNVIGPNNTAGQGACNNITYPDADLMSIEPQAYYDVCVIEMDCVPTDDTLYFNYVFGSEEYPEFVLAPYNDAFGIFVSGANPAGGNYASSNMTVLPTGGPVSINNVNASVNSQYYLSNTSDTTLQYDGTTVNLTAVIPVVPGQTYHVKIIVGEAGDCIYDSGVFLQAGSFRCAGQPLDVAATTNTESQVSVYPNPANASVLFTFSTLESSYVYVELRSIDGKTVLSQNFVTDNNAVSVDVSTLPEGIYIAEITNNGIRESKKIVVKR